jgi:hypothetical protein
MEAIDSIQLRIPSFHDRCSTSLVGKGKTLDQISLSVHLIAQISAINFCFVREKHVQRVIIPKIPVIKVLNRICVIIPLGGIHGKSENIISGHEN